MGLDYSFVVVTTVGRVDDLLTSVSARVEEDDANRLSAALPWSPAIDRVLPSRRGPPVRHRSGIANLVKASTEVGLDLCFAFRFPPDPDLVEFKWPHVGRRPSNLTHVSIGCVWCRLVAGEERAVLSATAATSDMSEAFDRSVAARALWQELGARSGASAVFWDFEDPQQWKLLFPGEPKAVPKPHEDPDLLADGVQLDVDRYYTRALISAGIEEPESHDPAV